MPIEKEDLERDYLDVREEVIRKTIAKGLICVVPALDLSDVYPQADKFVLTIDADEPISDFSKRLERLESKLPVKFGPAFLTTSPGGNGHKYVEVTLTEKWWSPAEAQPLLAVLLGSDPVREALSAARGTGGGEPSTFLFETPEYYDLLRLAFGDLVTILRNEADITKFFEGGLVSEDELDNLLGTCA